MKKAWFLFALFFATHTVNADNRLPVNHTVFKGKHFFDPFPTAETPGSVACVYGFTQAVPGCTIKAATAVPTGGWGAIAVVDACDYPDADLNNAMNTFTRQYKLPDCNLTNGCLTKVYSTGTKPTCTSNLGEESLDVEWSHAMAPNAKIFLVETPSGTIDDIVAGVDVASQQVVNTGGGEVSVSYAYAESSDEQKYDSHFQTPGVVYLFSAADNGAPARYPSASPYVISAGGAAFVRDGNGNFIGETAWNLDPQTKKWGSGGPSLYEPRPSYQNSVMKVVGSQRGTPDIAYISTNVSTYIVNNGVGYWTITQGTSISAPALAGVINAANSRAQSSTQELNYIYSNALKNYHSYWTDILSGYNGYPALPGYDFTTGLGTPLTYQGK